MSADPSPGGGQGFMKGIQLNVALVALLVTLLSFIVNRVHERRINQAELLRNYTNDFYSDTHIPDLFMKLDADVDEDSDGERERYAITPQDIGTDNELALIRLLDFLNILGYNWFRRVVRLSDIAPTTLGYTAVRLYANPSIVSYLERIERLDQRNYLAGNGFGYYRELAVALASYPSSASSDRAGLVKSALRRTHHELIAITRARLRLLVPRGVATTTSEVLIANARAGFVENMQPGTDNVRTADIATLFREDNGPAWIVENALMSKAPVKQRQVATALVNLGALSAAIDIACAIPNRAEARSVGGELLRHIARGPEEQRVIGLVQLGRLRMRLGKPQRRDIREEAASLGVELPREWNEVHDSPDDSASGDSESNRM